MPKRLCVVLLSWCCVVLLYYRPLQAVPFPILNIVNPDKFDHPLTWSPHHLGSARLPEGTLAGWYDSNDIQANDIVFLPWVWGARQFPGAEGISFGATASGSAGSTQIVFNVNHATNNNTILPGMLMKFDADSSRTVYRIVRKDSATQVTITPALTQDLTQAGVYVGYILSMQDKSGFQRTAGAYPLASSFKPGVYIGMRQNNSTNNGQLFINGHQHTYGVGSPGYLNVQHPFMLGNAFDSNSYTGWTTSAYQSGALNAPASGNSLMREVVVLNKALSSSEREQLEGYLAWKWGFAGELRQTHPYVQAAPSGWSPTALQANLLLWLDANRPATLFSDTACTAGATAGQAIACWQDLSGYARHLMQGNALYRPLHTPGSASYAAGLPGVEVRPNHHLLTANAATWLNNTNFTLVTVQNRIYTEQGLNIGGYPNHSHAYTGAVIGVEPKLTNANAGYNPNTFLYFPHISLTQAGMIQGLPNELLNDYRYIPPVAIAESANDIIKYHPYFGYTGSLATRENATWLHQSPYLIATVVSLVGNLNHSSFNCLLGIVAPQSGLYLNRELELNAPKFANYSDVYSPPPENVAVNHSRNLITRTNIPQPFEEKRLYLVWRTRGDQIPLISVNGDNAKNANYYYAPWSTYHGTGGFVDLRPNILSVFALGDCRTGERDASGNPHGPVATMYETIVIAGNVRYGHQRLIEGYLAWKWGIQRKLPRNHPYYRVPPRKS